PPGGLRRFSVLASLLLGYSPAAGDAPSSRLARTENRRNKRGRIYGTGYLTRIQPTENLVPRRFRRGPEHVVIGAPDHGSAAISRATTPQPPTHETPRHQWIHQTGQIINWQRGLTRDRPEIVIRDDPVAMNDRPPVRFDRPVGDKLRYARQRFRSVPVTELGIAGIGHAKTLHPPERYGSAHPAGHADRPIHRLPDTSPGENQTERTETRANLRVIH